MPEDNIQSNPTVDDMLNLFGVEPEAQDEPTGDDNTTPPDDDASAESGEQDIDVQDDQGQDDQGDQSDQDQQQQQTKISAQTKQNQAFARMRTENAQMTKTIQRMAQVLGLDPKQPIDQLAAAIQQQSTNALAKKQNIDPAILNRLDELEARDARYRQLEYENVAKTAFQEIQDRFGATAEDLQHFVQDIVRDGYDISAPGANLVTEFINRNFDAILQYKVDAAVRAEQERSTKASGASKPSTKQGQSKQTTDNQDVSSMDDMENFLNSLI